jgi:curved DNA-binding protein CbpA
VSKQEKFDPYDALGVGRMAGKGEIRAAYMKRAKETHPDAGGSAEEFEKVSHAYKLLTDQRLRDRYDRTGSTEADVDNVLANAINGLGFRFAAVLGHPDAERVDIVRLVRNSLDKDIDNHVDDINKHKTNIEKIEKIKKRIVKKGGKMHDFVQATYDDMIGDAKKKILHAEDEIRAFEKSKELLKDYACKPPEKDDPNGLDAAMRRLPTGYGTNPWR